MLHMVLAIALMGQLDVPKEMKLGDPMVVTLKTTIPEGAIIDGGWETPEGMGTDKTVPGKLFFWVKGPGTYKITYKAFWLNIKEVKFKDGEGKEVILQSYLGHGLINETAEVKVTSENPPPTPQPGGKWRLMFFYDRDQFDNYPKSQREILNSLVYREHLKSLGHNVLEIIDVKALEAGVPATLQPWVDSIKGKTLPCVAFAHITDKSTIQVYPLPLTTEAMDDLLK
jgi:hypothetical protein